MDDYENMIVNLSRSEDEDLAAGLRRSYMGCPKDVCMHLNAVYLFWRQQGGIKKAEEQMNGRTIAELLKVTVPATEEGPLLLRGTRGGVSFRLHRAKDEDSSVEQ